MENKLNQAAGLDPAGECVSAALDIFSGPLVETAIERCYYSEIHPITPVSDTQSTVSFHVPSSEDFTDLSESWVSVKIKIDQINATTAAVTNGAAQTATDSYGLLNQPAASLFSSVNVRLNDTLLSDSYATYPYLSYLQVC